MKYLFLFMLAAGTNTVHAQVRILNFSIHNPHGQDKHKRIMTGKKLDIVFYHDNFSIRIPTNTAQPDRANAGKTVVEWANPNQPKDYEHNWTDTYQYDSLGRLTTSEYSSCMICGRFHHIDSLEYDRNGRLVSIYSGMPTVIATKESLKLFDKDPESIKQKHLHNTSALHIKHRPVTGITQLNIEYNIVGEVVAISTFRGYGKDQVLEERIELTGEE